MRKINLYKSLSLVLVGGGVLATIPAVLTSCKKKDNGDDENLKKVDKYLNLTTNKATWGQDIASQKQGSNSIGNLKVKNTLLSGFCTNSNPKINIDNSEIFIIGANYEETSIIKILINQTYPSTIPVGVGSYTLIFQVDIANIDSPLTPIERLFITDIELVVK